MEVEEAIELVTKEKNINVRTHPRYALCRDSESALLHVVSSLSLWSKQLVSCQLFTRVFYFVPLSSPLLPSLFSFVKQLTPSLVRICGVRSLLGEVEALRAQAYSQEDEEHERMLLEVGGHVPPL